MKIANQSKLRLAIRMICKAAKTLGLELEEFIEMVQEEWDRS